MLGAITRGALGGPPAAGHTPERALDLAEPNRTVMAFLPHPAPGPLQRHARQRTAHAALVADILSLLPARLAPTAGPRPPLEALSGSEIRVLRYPPANLPGGSGFRLQPTPPAQKHV